MPMKTYGLIGYRLGHSFSKKYFTQKFSAENITDCEYRNFELDRIADFPALLSTYPHIVGLSCTIPYKREIIAHLNDLSEEARQIGAVNTIKVVRSKGSFILKGFNTDCYGFEMSLKPLLKPHHTKALVLGTGGAAQAVLYVLKKLKIEAKSVSRTANSEQDIWSYEQLSQEIMSQHSLLINTTPLGTSPKTNECPNIPYEFLSNKHYLYDLVYNPALTLFLQKGKEKGACIKNGAEMLELQAERSWEIWNNNNLK